MCNKQREKRQITTSLKINRCFTEQALTPALTPALTAVLTLDCLLP